MSASPRLPFIDYLKCTGIAVIVYGHTAGWAPLANFPPIYLKQFGVAFFLWVLGYSLARETRSVREILFNRLFDVYLFGLLIASIVSAEGLMSYGRWAPSNYVPFVLGANVLFNGFPANPSTWYIGTYIHFLLAWALLFRRVTLTRTMLVSALGFEVVARAALLQYAGNFTAYITMPNWITVFLAGCYMGQKDIRSAGGTTAGWTAVLLAGGALWLAVGARAPLAETFPIMTLAPASLAGALAVSVAVSVVYLGTTLCAFAIFATCPSSRVVAFFARNTLIVFVAHMPVVYWLLRVLPNPAQSAWTSAVLILVCLPGLAGVSEIVRSATPITALRSWARRRVVSREPSSTAAVPVSA